jgi:hypothetical protein
MCKGRFMGLHDLARCIGLHGASSMEQLPGMGCSNHSVKEAAAPLTDAHCDGRKLQPWKLVQGLQDVLRTGQKG